MSVKGQSSTMSGEEFKNDLNRYGLSQIGFARMIGVNERTVRKWASGSLVVPRSAEYIMSLISIIEGRK